MIKALIRNPASGARIAVIGLSGENLTRLMAGEPILVDLADFGLPSQGVALVGGRTEADIERDLRGAFVDRTTTQQQEGTS